MVWAIGQRKSQVYLMPFPTYCWQIWLPYCIICISPIIGIMQIIPSLFRGKMWKIAIGLVQLALSAAGVLLFFTTPTVSGGMCIDSAFTTWQAGIKPPLGGDEWLACTLASQTSSKRWSHSCLLCTAAFRSPLHHPTSNDILQAWFRKK